MIQPASAVAYETDLWPARGWAELIPVPQWEVYARVLRELERKHITYAVGGGLAFSYYARRWRNTKDIDLYVRPQDRKAVVAAVRRVGLRDYREVKEYDPAWIYRSHDGAGNIVDIIWQMANYRAQVDEAWLTRGPRIEIHEMPVRLLPPEELMWSKLYVLQRDRCDWGDLLNILYVRAEQIDWPWLLARVGEDWRVLAGVVQLFTWACPERAGALPIRVMERLAVDLPEVALPDRQSRIRLLDSRDWFGPTE